MEPERDVYGRIIDPVERHHDFLLAFHDLQKEMEDFSDFSGDALKRLEEVRVVFIAEFKGKFPGAGKGRALWENDK